MNEFVRFICAQLIYDIDDQTKPNVEKIHSIAPELTEQEHEGRL